jgi:hypothetical protein
MLMSMCGAWIGEDRVQQGFSSQEGGPRLIRFEFPRWRPKRIQVRAQFGVPDQCASNGTGLNPKYVLNQRKSSKEVNIQNLSGRYANTFWAVGPIGGPCGPRVLFTHVNRTIGTVVSPLVAARGYTSYLDRPLIYFQTRVCLTS